MWDAVQTHKKTVPSPTGFQLTKLQVFNSVPSGYWFHLQVSHEIAGHVQKVGNGTLGPERKMCREQMPKNNPNKAPVFPKQIINLEYPRKHG